MLDELHVADVALIRDARMAPAAGLTVVTGETGAGKTALVGALRLISGARADKSIVREGADAAFVEARFLPDDLVVARTVEAAGKSRARINGAMASATELSAKVAGRIEVCSQHDTVRLVDESYQRELLDARGGAATRDALAAYESAWDTARTAAAHAAQVAAEQNASAARIEDARYLLSQAGDIDPTQREYDDIIAALQVAENAEALARAAADTQFLLNGEGGARDKLSGAVSALDAVASQDESLAARADILREALYSVEDISRELIGYAEAIDFDAAELEQMQELASRYQLLMRKFGPSIKDVAARLQEARDLIASIDDGADALARAQAAAAAAEDALVAAAANLSAARAAASPAFAAEVVDAMSRLCMGSARLEVDLQPLARDAWTRAGADAVRFMYRPASDMSARPLAKIASGGELSRVLLAIYVTAAENNAQGGEGGEGEGTPQGGDAGDGLFARSANSPSPSTLEPPSPSPSPSPNPTYIFDEIDAGVGGETANALAAELAGLARTHQVIVVTHLAQIAAAADMHYLVEKTEDAGIAQTDIREVAAGARTREIARMLSGRPTDASLAHARELLDAKPQTRATFPTFPT